MTHRRKCLHNTCCAQYRLTNSRKTCTNAGDLQQFRTGPQENRRHSGIGLHTPASVHYGTATEIQAQRAATLDAAYKANPAFPAPTAHPAEAAHRRLDQRTNTRSAHQIRVRNCLTSLDIFPCANHHACVTAGPMIARSP